MQIHTRIFSKDTTLWGQTPNVQKKISNRLGWLDAPTFTRKNLNVLNQLTEKVISAGFKHVVLLGMGGSSLASEVFKQLLPQEDKQLSMDVLDNTNPKAVNHFFSQLVVTDTIFIVATKSGTTLETKCLFDFFYNEVKKVTNNPGQHFIAITDPASELEALSNELDFFDCLLNPADIGGRYSALSYFGMLPAALLGWDVEKLTKRAELALQSNQKGTGLGFQLGKWMSKIYDNPTHVLNFIIEDEKLKTFFLWIEQLVAESVGKQGHGVLPALDTISTAESTQSVSLSFSNESDQFNDDSAKIYLMDHYDIAAQFFHWEIATVVLAEHIQINPFDEPNVTEAKQKTAALLLEEKPIVIPQMAQPIEEFIKNIPQSEYLGLLVYTDNTENCAANVQQIRQHIEEKYNLPVTVNMGPRYLHSVGQLHKGGKQHGAFLVLLDKPGIKVLIPGKDYSFKQLFYAQALGDWQILQEKGLPSAIYEVDSLSELATNL